MNETRSSAHGRWSAALAAVAALGLVLSLAPPATAQGESAWPQYSADAENSRQGVASAPSDPGLRWHLDLEDHGYSMGRTTYGFVGLEQPVLGPDGTVITRADGEDPEDEDDTVPYLLGLDADTGEIAWAEPHPALMTRCGPAVDSEGRLWTAQNPDDHALGAVDPTSGELDEDSVNDETVRCDRSTLHIGGDPQHIAVFDLDGFGVYDISGTAPVEQWVFDDDEQDDDLLGWSARDAQREAVLTDGSLIVSLLDETGEDAVASIVEFDLATGDEQARAEVEVMPDGDGEAGHHDINSVQLVRDGDTLVAATYVNVGAGYDGNGSIAAYDLSAGLDAGPQWVEGAAEPGEPQGVALGDGEVYIPHRTGVLATYDLETGDRRVVTENPRTENRSFITDADGGALIRAHGDDLDLDAEALAHFDATGTPQWAFDRAGLEEAAGLTGDDEEFDFGDAMIGPMAHDGAFLIGSATELAMIDSTGGLDTLGPVDDEDRTAGADRIETAIELSQEFESADEVVIARSDAYPDALAGAPLASHLEAPILLTGSDSLNPAVADEIERLDASQARLLGGDAALSAAVEASLDGLGLDTERYDGANRWDTAAQIADDLPDADTAFVVRGQGETPETGWEDAVAVSALAAFTETPILLTGTDALPSHTEAALAGLEAATIVGGTAVVTSDVEAEVETTVTGDVDRIWGADRYATSAAVADASVSAGMDPSRTWIATGRNFPDSLAAAPVVGATAPEIAADAGGVLLLVDGHDLDNSDASRDWITTNADDIDHVRAVGGTAVVTDATLDAARSAAGIE